LCTSPPQSPYSYIDAGVAHSLSPVFPSVGSDKNNYYCSDYVTTVLVKDISKEQGDIVGISFILSEENPENRRKGVRLPKWNPRNSQEIPLAKNWQSCACL